MSEKIYRECELKYKITNEEELNKIIKVLTDNQYLISNYFIETDLIFDTDDKKCSKNKLLLRVRNKSNDTGYIDVVFTIKIKGYSDIIQDNYEFETSIKSINSENIKSIISIIKKFTQINIDKEIFFEKKLFRIITYLKNIGFTSINIIQKKREEYYNEKSKVTIDVFPNHIGTYLEIEESSEIKLMNTVYLLKLKHENMEKRNYGEIIKDSCKKGFDGTKCFFKENILVYDDYEKEIGINELLEIL